MLVSVAMARRPLCNGMLFSMQDEYCNNLPGQYLAVLSCKMSEVSILPSSFLSLLNSISFVLHRTRRKATNVVVHCVS